MNFEAESSGSSTDVDHVDDIGCESARNQGLNQGSSTTSEPTTDGIVTVAERLATKSVSSRAGACGDGADIDIAGKTVRFGRAQGDFYSFQNMPYGSFMMVGDVGAAGDCSEAAMQLLPSAIAQAASDHLEPDPLALLTAVASVIYRDLVEEGVLATLTVATWDSAERNLVVSYAGHCPLLHASGSGVRQLESADAPIGTRSRLVGVPEVISLAPGDFLLMGTDGLVAQEDRTGMEFGLPRLAQTLLDGRGLPAGEVVADVMATVQAHGRGVRQLDDRTALVVTRPVSSSR